MLRRTFGPKREGIARNGETLHNEELRGLKFMTNTVRTIK